MQAEHVPVLSGFAAEIILKKDAVVFDATTGCGGHSKIFAQSLDKDAVLVCLDVDENSLALAKKNLAGVECKTLFIRENFAAIGDVAAQNGIKKADLVFADLGVCSVQLSDSSKGLSFGQNMKLDMRLDNRLKITAADIVNDRDETDLANLIYEFGQERASRRIARSIVSARSKRKIESTSELANIICRSLKCNPDSRRSRIHPATKTFQALRIAVNSELDCLEKFLEVMPGLLNKDGKVAVISFHSLEDKIVKDNFRRNKQAGIYNVVTKKPVIASLDEQRSNPRSRSAKLRMAVRI